MHPQPPKDAHALILEPISVLHQKRNLADVINQGSNDGAITLNHSGGPR